MMGGVHFHLKDVAIHSNLGRECVANITCLFEATQPSAVTEFELNFEVKPHGMVPHYVGRC